MNITMLMIIAIAVCFIICLASSWPRGYSSTTIASAVGLLLTLILLFNPS